MIISASRRTDIPAFYSRWLMHRLRLGRCTVANPFNPQQLAEISLRPEEVEAIVFWTRNPRPLFRHLEELDQRGFRYYFQYTLMDYPAAVEPHTPPLAASLRTFAELAGRVGAERVIWRYDPILLSEATPAAFHLETFGRIAGALHNATRRVVVSFFDFYPKLHRRLKMLESAGIRVRIAAEPPETEKLEAEQKLLAAGLAEIAARYNLEITSCAEEMDLATCGIQPGKCIDAGLIRQLFGLQVDALKDPRQRKACGCAVSRDIGAYDTCLFGCQYCYATRSFKRSAANYHRHDPAGPALI